MLNKNIPVKLTDAKKILWFLAVYAFWAVLAILLVEIAIGGILFYKYAILSENQDYTESNSVIFKTDLYNEILDEWQARDAKDSELSQPVTQENN